MNSVCKYFLFSITAIFTILLVSSAKADVPASYCAAVRGNGDSMPAHWGAMAEMMEVYGAPSGMAGGSSASISTFLWESADLNPSLTGLQGFERGDRLALMFKSLEGVTTYLYHQPRWNKFATWINAARQMPSRLQDFLSIKSLADLTTQWPMIKDALQDLHSSGIFYGPAIRGIQQAIVANPSPAQMQIVWHRIQALQQTLAVFGTFDAKADKQLFIRPGIVDFAALARQFGALGDYMSMRHATPESRAAFNDFVNACEPNSKGHTWSEVVAAQPQCQDLLGKSLDLYFGSYDYRGDSRIFDKIGAHARTIVATAIVTGASADRFRKLNQNYQQTFSAQLGDDFQVSDGELRFGYWGSTSDLTKIQAAFQTQTTPLLDKQKRFANLGQATWMQVLSLSPAEPGLSSALELSSVGLPQNAISFGGWADLHPMQVLKAAGCENVVYLQRRGGDTLFAEGIVKRLTGFTTPEWTTLTDQFNNAGSASDMTSLWSRFFNVQNPQSNYAASIRDADAVLCTDWNAYDSKNQFDELISTSFKAPIYESKVLAHAPNSRPQLLQLSDNGVDAAKGFAPYVGCMPIAR